MIKLRDISVLLVISILTLCAGCGWGTPESKHNSMTGVSESGYPGGQPADSGSPAMGVAKRPEKAGEAKKSMETKPAESK